MVYQSCPALVAMHELINYLQITTNSYVQGVKMDTRYKLENKIVCKSSFHTLGAGTKIVKLHTLKLSKLLIQKYFFNLNLILGRA